MCWHKFSLLCTLLNTFGCFHIPPALALAFMSQSSRMKYHLYTNLRPSGGLSLGVFNLARFINRVYHNCIALLELCLDYNVHLISSVQIHRGRALRCAAICTERRMQTSFYLFIQLEFVSNVAIWTLINKKKAFIRLSIWLVRLLMKLLSAKVFSRPRQSQGLLYEQRCNW